MTNTTKLSARIQTVGILSGTVGAQTMNARLNVAESATVASHIYSYNSIYEFPNRGTENSLYIVKSENKSYRWDESAKRYYCVGSDYKEIKIVNGGKANG